MGKRMQCDKCRNRAIIHQRYSGLHLCREHFTADVGSKAKKTVRFSGGLLQSDHILLACHADYRGAALLHFMAMLTGKRRGIRLSATLVDCDGTEGDAVRSFRNLADSLGIRYTGICCAGNGRTGASGDPCAATREDDGIPLPPAVIVYAPSDTGATKIAGDMTLDDGALAVLTAILRGEPDRLLGPGRSGSDNIPAIRPFLHIPEREVALYARLTTGWQGGRAGSFPKSSLPEDARLMLREHSARHPSAPHALVRLGERLMGYGVPGSGRDMASGRRGTPPARHGPALREER